MSHQRISVGMGFGSIGRDRLLFRHEAAARIRWQRDVGVWVDVKGARTAIPMVAHDEAARCGTRSTNEMNDPDLMGEIPYYPGYEPLWVGGGDIARAQVDETEIVNPDRRRRRGVLHVRDRRFDQLHVCPTERSIQLRELRDPSARAEMEPRASARSGSTRSPASSCAPRTASRCRWTSGRWRREEDPKSMDDVPVG